MSEPNIISQLFSFSKAVIKQVAAGCPAASDEAIKKRAETCSACPSLNKEEYRCGECGCYLKYKIPWATSECPLNRWEKTNDNTNE